MNETAQQIETALEASYRQGVALLESQPLDERGALIVLSLLDEDMMGFAYGTPAAWTKILVSVATRDDNFCLALALAYQELRAMANRQREDEDDEADD